MADVLASLAAVVYPPASLPLAGTVAAFQLGKKLLSGAQADGEESAVEKADGGDADASTAAPTAGANGKVPPVTLRWKDVSYEVRARDGKRVKLLDDCTGEAKPGRILAIMGPSGAGKTMLLNALAHQLPFQPHAKLTGAIASNDRRIASDGNHAYVTQNQYFFSCLTVRETIEFSARVRLPQDTPVEARSALVESLIRRLGLIKCADTYIGDARTVGISGGEKKRVSLACEMISTPSLIFVDEPTSGLDSFQAQKVMETLEQLAHEFGHTVVCSIHQPRGSIYALFDDVCLLSEGRALYAGAAADALPYFSELGHRCPSGTNAAEFFADLIAVDYSSPESERRSRERVDALAKSAARRLAPRVRVDARSLRAAAALRGGGARALGPLAQLRVLYARALRQVLRDRKSNLSRVIPCISSAIMFGCIYWRVGHGARAVTDRVGLFQVCATNAAMLSLTRTLHIFPAERTLVDRERVRRSYTVLPYLTGKILAELPLLSIPPTIFASVLYPMAGLEGGVRRIASFMGVLVLESAAAGAIGVSVGSLAPTPESALALGPAVMLLFILFGGYYVSDVPRLLRWLPRVSVIRWTFEALCLNQLRGVQFGGDGEATPLPSSSSSSSDSALATATDGEQVLTRFGWGGDTLRGSVLELARITLFFYTLGYGILRKRYPRFQRLEAPPEEQTAAAAAAAKAPERAVAEEKAPERAVAEQKAPEGAAAESKAPEKAAVTREASETTAAMAARVLEKAAAAKAAERAPAAANAPSAQTNSSAEQRSEK